MPLLVAAFTPPAPVRLAVGAGFCAVVEADGAALEGTLGLEACAWAAELTAVLAAVLVAVFVKLLLALDVADVALAAADFESAAADSVEPVTLAAAALPVLETLPAVSAAASPVTVLGFTAVAAGCDVGLLSDPPTAPWPWKAP
jgi:hypothetical protein